MCRCEMIFLKKFYKFLFLEQYPIKNLGKLEFDNK